MERVQTLLLQHIICYKRTVPHHIIQARFRVHPFRLEVISHLVSFLHRVGAFRDSTTKRQKYPYLALCSSKAIASETPSGHAHGCFTEASWLLRSMTISPELLHLVYPLMDHHISYRLPWCALDQRCPST